MQSPSLISKFRIPLSAVSVACAALAAALGHAAPLWQIGKPDNSAAEFALAPNGHEKFERGGLFIVGESDPAKDWPYIQPGPADANWAPGGPHPFSVWFVLDALPQADSVLVIDCADTQESIPPKLRVTLNERSWGHQTTAGAGAHQQPDNGTEHLASFTIPAVALKKGVNRLSITNIAGSWLAWDNLRFEAGEGTVLGDPSGHSFTALGNLGVSDGLFWKEKEKVHHVTVEIAHLGEKAEAKLRVGTTTVTANLVNGMNSIVVPVPAVSDSTEMPVELSLGDKQLDADTITLQPVREWTVHLIHQTHLDIGYTHVQEEVLARQVDYFRRALDLIDETKDYPEGACFIWHPEGMWAVDEFLRVATPEERERFLEACRSRRIHLDALYAQAMSGLYSEEEMMELIAGAKLFEKEHGVTIDSAMQTDVPGYSWGLATALAANGVRHISLGPNSGHRVGHTYHWGDRPFYWETPDGQDKILFWMSKLGYGMFHGGVQEPQTRADNQLLRRMDGVLSYLKGLEETGYPYDMTMLRYSIGADNGPPDKTLCDVVRRWNEKHVTPRFVIDSNSNFLRTFEERYDDKLPVMSGDFTPYWEDGAASTARATAANRRACEKIAQVQSLWAMVNPDLPLHKGFDEAWTKMVMYDEHTWGAHNSISAPDSEFAIRQDEYKQAFAFDAAKMTHDLLGFIDPAAPGSSTFDIYNTASWPRGGMVLLDAGQSSAGDVVRNANGKVVPSQRLASGKLAFLAKDIPAFGSRRYTIHTGDAKATGKAKAKRNRISNELLDLLIDPKTGAIASLRRKDADAEWVDEESGHGLNDYLYILGRNPEENRSTIEGPVSITVEDPGPLVATLRIESEAPGCEGLVRRVRVIAGLDHVELINTVDKRAVREPEGVYFGFPFNLPDATARVDTPWATFEVEKDQLPGANRNFYCVQRFIDLANQERGVTWVTIDAPMCQFDPIRIAPAWGTSAFRTFIDPKPFLWSWVMNNHWETNYKAYQQGEITYHYALRPYNGSYDAASSQHFGREICQPLLAVSTAAKGETISPVLKLEGDDAIVVTQLRPSRDGRAWMLRLFNTKDQDATTRLMWNRPVGKGWISNPVEDPIKDAPGELKLGPGQVLTLRFERDGVAKAASKVIKGVTASASSEHGNGIYIGQLLNQSGLRVAGSTPDREIPAAYDPTAVHTFDPNAAAQWHSAEGDPTPTITFDLGGTYDLEAIHIWNGNQTNLPSRGVHQFDILVSTDGKNFKEALSDQTLDAAPGNAFVAAQRFDLGGHKDITHVRLRVDSNHGDGFTGLSEVMFTRQVGREP